VTDHLHCFKCRVKRSDAARKRRKHGLERSY
jgi:hypothetical protein